MRTFLQFCFAAALAAVLANAAVIQNGANFDVSYEVLLNGTLNGNPITSIMVMEAGAGQSSQDYPFSLAASGVSSFTHTIPFYPTTALVIGLNLPTPGVGDGKIHIFMLVNDAFAASADGVKFSEVFANTRHNDLIVRLQAAQAGDATQQQWFLDFFLTGDGALAAFSPTGSFTAVEFTAGTVIGGDVPEPSTLILVSLAGVALLFRRRIS
jgi:hypothetical protein